MLLLCKPGFYVAGNLVLCSGGDIGIPRLVGHVLVMLLVVLLLLLLLVKVLGGDVAEVGRIHGRRMRRGIGGAVVHGDCMLWRVDEVRSSARTGDSEDRSSEGAREDGKT